MKISIVYEGNFNLNQILFDELVEFPRKRLESLSVSFVQSPRMTPPPTAKRKKSINPQKSDPLGTELCVEMDEPEFMGYGAGALNKGGV